MPKTKTSSENYYFIKESGAHLYVLTLNKKKDVPLINANQSLPSEKQCRSFHTSQPVSPVNCEDHALLTSDTVGALMSFVNRHLV